MKNIFSILALVVIVYSCSNPIEKLGTQYKPVRFYFTPSVELDILSQNAEKLVNYLDEQTGLHYKKEIPYNYKSVVDAFGSARADVAILNSFGYIMAHEKHQATVKLKVIRFGKSDYRGQIIGSKENNINQLTDIECKIFAFTDPSSTSGYLLPLHILEENQITPAKTVFERKHSKVVEMIYNGLADAGATYYRERPICIYEIIKS